MLNRFAAISVFHQYTDRNSDIPAFSYDKQQVGINVTARSPDRPYDEPDEQTGSAAERWSQPTVDLRELLRILRRRWKLVAAAPAGLFAVALVYPPWRPRHYPRPPPPSWSHPRRSTAS